MSISLLDPIWTKFELMAFGGVHGRYWNHELRHRNFSQLVRRISITDSVHQASRVAEIELDNTQAHLVTTAHIGTHWALWGHEYDPVAESPTDWREIFVGSTFDDTRSVSGGSASTRRYKVYEFAGNALGRNEGTLVFDAGTNPVWTEGPTMTEVCQTIGDLLQIPFTTLVDTGVCVGALVQSPGMTYWDLIEEAARRTLDRSGRRYIVRSDRSGHRLELLPFGDTGVVWKLNDGDAGILADVDLNESAEDIGLSVQAIVERAHNDDANSREVYSATAFYDDPEIPGDGGKPDFRTWLGGAHRVVTPEADYGQGDPEAPIDMPGLQGYADQQLANLARSIVSVSTSSLLIPGVRRGDEVRVSSMRWGIRDVPFYVKSVVTNYEPGVMLQTMDLVLDPRDG